LAIDERGSVQLLTQTPENLSGGFSQAVAPAKFDVIDFALLAVRGNCMLPFVSEGLFLSYVTALPLDVC